METGTKKKTVPRQFILAFPGTVLFYHSIAYFSTILAVALFLHCGSSYLSPASGVIYFISWGFINSIKRSSLSVRYR